MTGKKSEELSEHELDKVQGGDGTPDSIWIDLGFPVRIGETPPQQIEGDPDQPVITGRLPNAK